MKALKAIKRNLVKITGSVLSVVLGLTILSNASALASSAKTDVPKLTRPTTKLVLTMSNDDQDITTNGNLAHASHVSHSSHSSHCSHHSG